MKTIVSTNWKSCEHLDQDTHAIDLITFVKRGLLCTWKPVSVREQKQKWSTWKKFGKPLKSNVRSFSGGDLHECLAHGQCPSAATEVRVLKGFADFPTSRVCLFSVQEQHKLPISIRTCDKGERDK